MDWAECHPHPPDASFDGGDLDCGNGLLLLIRRHLDPLARGQLLEVRSTEVSVEEDLPSWARLTGNELVSRTRQGRQRSYLICKGSLAERRSAPAAPATPGRGREAAPVIAVSAPGPAPAVPPLSVMGIGSWPRPRWLLRALHEYL